MPSPNPQIAALIVREDAERFWAKVELIPFHECWEWCASLNVNGYGQFSVGGRNQKAHRWLWQQLRGPIPEGLTLDHLCRNRSCVRPDHLEAVTMRTNVLRGIGPTANNARRKVCVNGHTLSGSNLIIDKRGRRNCRVCQRRRSREYMRRKRAG